MIPHISPARIATLVAMVLLLAAMIRSTQATEDSPLTAEDGRLFEWFDTLGYPAPHVLPYVRVTYQDERKERQFVHGFLLEDSETTFQVLTPALGSRAFRKQGEATREEPLGEWVELDLESEGARLFIGAEEHRFDTDEHGEFGLATRETTELITLARYAAARGLDLLAHDLCEYARNRPPRHPKYTGTVQSQVAEALAYRDLLHAQYALASTGWSRSDQLRAFERVVNRFPETTHAGEARRCVGILRRMIADQAGRSPIDDGAWEKSSLHARLDDLVLLLQEQSGDEFIHPGGCVLDDKDRQGRATPAARLTELAFDAFPHLIACVDDNRFTRATEFWGICSPQKVLTVGECALLIMTATAGPRFYDRLPHRVAWQGRHPSVAEQVRAWWQDFEEKGERAMLIEATFAGDHTSADHARWLLHKYPIDAPTIILGAARETRVDWVRAKLIALLAGDGRAATRRALWAELEHGPHLQSRAAAARALGPKSGREVVDVCIREWLRMTPEEAANWWAGPADLAWMLVESRHPRAIDALGERLSTLGQDGAEEVVSLFEGVAHERSSLVWPDEPYYHAIQSALSAALSVWLRTSPAGAEDPGPAVQRAFRLLEATYGR